MEFICMMNEYLFHTVPELTILIVVFGLPYYDESTFDNKFTFLE